MNSRGIPVIIIGLSAILLQIISLRQLLTAFSGNELVIGITLSVWLTAVGTGSYLGHRIRFKNSFAISFMAVALLSQPAILFINLIRFALPMESGETIPLTTAVLSTIAALLPLCLVLGFQFPLAVSHLEGKSAKAYGLEAVGAFLGGAFFTFVLSGRMDALQLCAVVSGLNILTALLLLRKKSIAMLFLIPVVFYFGFNKINSEMQWKGFQFIERAESRYGEISVLKLREQFNVYASGKFQFSYPDSQTEELRTNMTMPVHPSPFRILVIGGSPSVLREFLKYPVSKADFLEIDPKIIDVASGLLGKEDSELLKDKRIRIVTEDARRFIKKLKAPDYDIIVLNLPEPSTANINRFYTTDFFREAGAALKENGILSLSLPASFGYIGKRMQMANGSVYNSLKEVFKYVEVSSEEYGYFFASGSPVDINPDTLNKRFSGREIATMYFSPYIFYDAFSSLKVSMVKERLGKITTTNTDQRPVSYLYNLMLWAEVHGGRMFNYILEQGGLRIALIAVIALLIVMAVLWKKKQAVYFSMFTTGYSLMTFSIVIILTYQSSFGYVYETIGLLTAVFMIGLAAGSFIIKGIRPPLRLLRLSEIAAIAFFIFSPQFFKNEIFFYILSLFCGALGGVQFAAASLSIRGRGDDSVKTAGRLYASDLAGSFLGAFSTAIFTMPVAGFQNTLLFAALIKGLSLILLFSIGYEKYEKS